MSHAHAHPSSNHGGSQQHIAPSKKPARIVTAEAIAARAYEKYLARAGADGQDREDWLSAEQELLAERESSAS